MAARWLYAWGVGSIAFGAASLLVPLYIVALGATPVQLGILAATAALIGAPGAILFGRLANRTDHRRPLVLATLVGVAGALAVIPTVTDVTAVIVANTVLWLAVASVAPVLTMLVVDDAPESAWGERIGRLNTFQGYGWAGGLILGAIWPLVGGRLVGGEAVIPTLFWLLAACAGASAAMAARTLPRPAPGDHVAGRRSARRVARIVAATHRGVRGATFAFSPNRLYWTTRGISLRRLRNRLTPALATYFLAAALFFTGFAAFWAPLPLFLTDAGFVSGQVFALYLASSLGSALLYQAAGRLSTQFDVRLLQAGALVVRGLLFPGVVAATWLGAMALALAVTGVQFVAIGVTWAIIAVVGTAIVTRFAPASVRGETLGIYTALASVAGGLGGVLGGWIASFGYLAAFAAAGGLVILGAVLVATLQALSGGDREGGRITREGPTGPLPSVSPAEIDTSEPE